MKSLIQDYSLDYVVAQQVNTSDYVIDDIEV
jgi:hypothetical protein